MHTLPLNPILHSFAEQRIALLLKCTHVSKKDKDN